MFGYMLYDGPVRVFDDRFVNFKKDVSSLLTADDNAFLKKYAMGRGITTAQLCIGGPKQGQGCNLPSDCPDSTCRLSPFVYEGDAALGWFQSNQSSYPTGTLTRGLSWVNTDLRHQIYTDLVSVNLEFNDGDKNTAVIDEDGTLTGYGVSASHHVELGRRVLLARSAERQRRRARHVPDLTEQHGDAGVLHPLSLARHHQAVQGRAEYGKRLR
jgi:hypothetical protein